MLEQITANLNVGRARRVWEGGRETIVAPMSLIMHNLVLAGSQGPLLYPDREISANYREWDGVPITVYHPIGANSASDRGVMARQGIGVVRQPSNNGKLGGYGHFDRARTEAADKRFGSDIWNRLDRCVRGDCVPLEISTGLFTTNVPAPRGSQHNGRAYTHVATEYVPDHVAILPTQVGACSVADGCGAMVAVNAENCGGEGGTPGPCASSANMMGGKKQHEVLAAHGYTHEGLKDEGSKQFRTLASGFVKKQGDETHRVTVEDARTKEGKNIGKWRSEHTTADSYKTAFGTGSKSLKEQLDKVHGDTTKNAGGGKDKDCGTGGWGGGKTPVGAVRNDELEDCEDDCDDDEDCIDECLDEVENALNCGGEGGTPGPCPTGGGDHVKSTLDLHASAGRGAAGVAGHEKWGKGTAEAATTKIAEHMQKLSELPKSKVMEVHKAMGFFQKPSSKEHALAMIQTRISGRMGAFDRVDASDHSHLYNADPQSAPAKRCKCGGSCAECAEKLSKGSPLDGGTANCGGQGGTPGPCAAGGGASHEDKTHAAYAKGLSAMRSGDHAEHAEARDLHLVAAEGRGEAAKTAEGKEKDRHEFMVRAHESSAAKHDASAKRLAANAVDVVSQVDDLLLNCGGPGGKPGPCAAGDTKTQQQTKVARGGTAKANDATRHANASDSFAGHKAAAGEHQKASNHHVRAGNEAIKAGDRETALKHFTMAARHEKKMSEHNDLAEHKAGKWALETANAGRWGNPQHTATGQYLPHGAGTGHGPVHDNAKAGQGPTPEELALAAQRREAVTGNKENGMTKNQKRSLLRVVGEYFGVLAPVRNSPDPDGVAPLPRTMGGPNAPGDDGRDVATLVKTAAAKTGDLDEDEERNRQQDDEQSHTQFHLRDATKTVGNAKTCNCGAPVANSAGMCANCGGKIMKTNQQVQQGDKAMATITKEKRLAMTDYIVANCDCWKDDEDRKVLNEMSPGQLQLIHAGAKITANAAKKGDDEEGEDDSEMDGKPAFLKNDKAEGSNADATGGGSVRAGGGDDGYDDEEADKKKAKKAENALAKWEADMPPEARAIWNTVKEAEAKERAGYINRLIVNVEDRRERKAAFNSFFANPKVYDVAELKRLVKLMPQRAPAENRRRAPERDAYALYSGNAGGGEGDGTVDNAADDAADDVLPAPTINYAAWKDEDNDAREAKRQRQQQA